MHREGLKAFKCENIRSIGVQMKQKELTKTFHDFFEDKLCYLVLYKILQCFKG